MTRVLAFDDDAIADAAWLVTNKRPVAVPTETVYGLAADATSGDAVAAIYTAKGRPSFNPLIVHVPDPEAAFAIGQFSPEARAFAERYWPGPLSIVVPLRASARITTLATAGLPTIALRVPAHRAMQALLRATGRPLAAPSANASGTISPTSAAHVMRTLNGRIPLIIDDGPTPGGLESTIITADSLGTRVLRPGPIDLGPMIDPVMIQAPGQLSAHYAPSKPLRLNATTADDGEWLIGFGEVAGDVTLSASGDPVEAASRLFALLHEADDGDALRIAVAPVPERGLGIAINDRLRRAAAGSNA